MVRLFIGVLVPEEVKNSAADVQGSIEKMPLRAKMVERENLHVSLSFLGERPPEEIADISRKLDDACRDKRRFTVKVGRILLIPNEDFMRVIALDLESNNDALEELRKSVVNSVGGDSHPAHLTLARVREVTNKNFVRDALKSVRLDKYFEIDSVCLIKSVMTRRGPTYEIVHESRLL